MIDILATRLHTQHLAYRHTQDPTELIKYLCCIQAQNYFQHLRAIGLRTGCSMQDITQAYKAGSICRTRTQRGTIHAVAAQDIKRIQQLCAAKTLSGFTKRRASLGISDKLAHTVVDEIQRYLKDIGKATRKQILHHLEEELSISFGKGRGYHFTCYAGTLGLIAMSELDTSGQPYYVLVEDLDTSFATFEQEAALVELIRRYFSSHGPATIHDFARWSGLGKTQIKQAIPLCKELESITHNEQTYYFNPKNLATASSEKNISSAIMLPGFDEFLLGYKDRSATVKFEHLHLIDKARNGIMKPTFMIDGITRGIWTIKKRTKVRDITISPFEGMSKKEKSLIEKVFAKYSAFVGQELIFT